MANYSPAVYTADLSNTVTTAPGYVQLKDNQLSIAWDYSSTADVNVFIDGVKTSSYTFKDAHTVELSVDFPVASLPSTISIERDTSVQLSVFSPGSSIRAEDLNQNFQQLQFKIEEAQ